MLDIVDAVEECEKHECSTVKTSTCEKCPSFFGVYTNLEGKRAVTCIYPNEEKYRCDALCIHYFKKECITENEPFCDQSDKYREVGDVADALKK